MPLHVLILTHHFPPEISAGANRFHQMAKVWVAAGHRVTLVTCTPNHPQGRVFPGYRNRLLQREALDGIDVIRIWTFIAANKGVVRRSLSQLSYLVSTALTAPFLPKADVVISSTPHFFAGLSGYPVSRLRRLPWILDIRDLWPDSIAAVGVMKPGLVMRTLKAIEKFGYRKATHIVSASDAFIPHFESCGVARDKVTVVTNGVDLTLFDKPVDGSEFRQRHGLTGKTVASYVGTHGMAHQLDIILDAADKLRADPRMAFVLVGDGAERERLVERQRQMGLTNVVMVPSMAREAIPEIWAASDIALVTLRGTPLFELVIPSKMFEAMAMRKPILLGVRGHAQRIVEETQSGLAFAPGSSEELVRGLQKLADDAALRQRLGDNGYHYVRKEHSSDALAQRYLDVLTAAADPRTLRRSDDSAAIVH